jgi:hypothetical protein
MNIYKKVCGKISDHRKYTETPFDEMDGSEKKVTVHPKLFAVMVKLPTASRVLLNYIVSNARNSKVELDYDEIIVPDAAVKSKALFRLGLIELLNWKVLARGEKKGVYWVNEELLSLPSNNQTEILFTKQAVSN